MSAAAEPAKKLTPRQLPRIQQLLRRRRHASIRISAGARYHTSRHHAATRQQWIATSQQVQLQRWCLRCRPDHRRQHRGGVPTKQACILCGRWEHHSRTTNASASIDRSYTPPVRERWLGKLANRNSVVRVLRGAALCLRKARRRYGGVPSCALDRSIRDTDVQEVALVASTKPKHPDNGAWAHAWTTEPGGQTGLTSTRQPSYDDASSLRAWAIDDEETLMPTNFLNLANSN